MDGRRRVTPARLLAPIALIAFTVAFLMVVAGSDTPDGSRDGADRRGERNGNATTTTLETGEGVEPRVRGKSYTVKTGDTLAAIAETVGVPVDRLLELNPDLDPQALVSGQKIRLRE